MPTLVLFHYLIRYCNYYYYCNYTDPSMTELLSNAILGVCPRISLLWRERERDYNAFASQQV